MKVRIPVTNVAELLRRRADAVGAKVAMVDGGRRLTWSELDNEVDALARGLSATGLLAGQRVALSLPNSVEFVVSYLAVLRAGMVAVPLNPTSTTGEVAKMLADSGARVCFCGPETLTQVRAAVGDVTGTSAPRLVVVAAATLSGETAYADLHREGADVHSPLDREALAVLLYTSGTSGAPRAAMLSHRALLANIDQASQTRPAPVGRDDVVLGVLPLFHVYGLNAVLGQVLLHGATLVLGRVERVDPAATLDLVAAEQVTVVPVAPPVIAAWLRCPDAGSRLGSVRTLLSGAAPLVEETVRAFEERTGVPVEQGYGLTEAAPIVTSTIGTAVHKPGSAGRAVPGVEMRLVDMDGSDVRPDDSGEIWVRGDNLFSGYWPDGVDAPAANGWLPTGDIGFLDADGDLFMVDRAKEIVIVSGFNVYPSEVEAVVLEVEGVLECAVIGIADERTGEAVHVYVVTSEPELAASMPDIVAAHCEMRLARFKTPATIEVVPELPRSANGKVAKGRLRAAQQRRSMGLA